jgi:hypothetical protein
LGDRQAEAIGVAHNLLSLLGSSMKLNMRFARHESRSFTSWDLRAVTDQAHNAGHDSQASHDNR